MQVDLEDLGFDHGGHLLIKRALRLAPPGEPIAVIGRAPDLATHLRAWCRAEGHRLEAESVIVPGTADVERWSGAERAGPTVVERPPQRWGLAGRGALVESGTPEFHFALAEKSEVWSSDAPYLYAQAAAAQWDPATAIPWDAACDLPGEVEDAVVQIMTYLVENETAALIVPSRFIAQLHPHFREVMQLLAIQAADEARHIEVFTRRALLKRRQLGFRQQEARHRCRRWWTSRTLPRRRSCFPCSGRGRSYRCSGLSRGLRPMRSPRLYAAEPPRTKPATWRLGCRIFASICSLSPRCARR
jgi:hypothetical protein